MGLQDCLPVRMNIFRWRRKKELASRMDARFGDPSISAPTQGSWNEMPPLRSGINQTASQNGNSPLKTLLRSETVEAPEFPNDTQHTTVLQHPMVDIQTHQRSISLERTKDRSEVRRSDSRKRQIPDTNGHKSSCESLSCSEEDKDEQPNPAKAESTKDFGHRNIPSRSHSQEDYWRLQSRNISQDGQNYTHHKSPPLSATSVMRRYSSQSESTRTYASTPSTATFNSSRSTSVTTPGLHGFSGSSIPPLLKEEDYATMLGVDIPPVPPIPADRTGSVSSTSSPPSASRSVFREHQRVGHSNKRENMGTTGLQELVPSHDELWGY